MLKYSTQKKGRGGDGLDLCSTNERQVKRLLEISTSLDYSSTPDDSNLQVESLIGPHTHGQ